MRPIYRLVVFVVFSVTFLRAETFTDEKIGYSVTLPENWVREIEDSTHHRFYDSSGTYQAVVALDCTDFSSQQIYTTADEWTQANFIAYAFITEADPFSALIFYDTVSVRQNDTLWAADAYTNYYDIDDTLNNWAEYIRFTATGRSGFELYAIGPLADLETNVAFYTEILAGIKLTIQPEGVQWHPRLSSSRPIVTDPESVRMCNLLGQCIVPANYRKNVSQVLVTRHLRQCIVK